MPTPSSLSLALPTHGESLSQVQLLTPAVYDTS